MSEKQTFLQGMFTRKGLFWIVLLVSLVADIATKAWADAYVRPTQPDVTSIIDGFIGWKWAENQGAAFSIMHGRPLLLALIAGGVLLAVFGYVYKAEPKRRWFLTALALVAAGAIGNLYDRILLGHVRDFMFFIFDLPFHGTSIPVLDWTIPLKYPVFNVADIEIIAGVLILVAMSFKPEKKKPAPESATDRKTEPEPANELQEAAHGA
ncbi:MAG: Lipoprotein signal peptidase [Planctomycetes bacterium]|nr:Lipoprotein signal peptidase [Planctomycetota bacterium]